MIDQGFSDVHRGGWVCLDDDLEETVMTERRPLLMTLDSELLDDLLGAAAAVGVAVDVAVEPTACRPQWTTAPLVLVGSDLAGAVVGSTLGPRPGVLLVARGAPGEGAWADAARIGVEAVVSLPAGESVLLERLADVAEPVAPARLVGVVSGRGGAGGSVLAAALALTAAAEGATTWLVDMDPFGGGADVGLGAELVGGARWTDLGVVAGRLSGATLREALPDVLGVAVLAIDAQSSGEPAVEAVRAVLAAARRGGGTVVLDLPRHPGAGREEAMAASDEVLVVVPAEVRAVLATRQLIARLGPARPPVRVVVRTLPHGLPPHEVVRGLGLPLGGELADEPEVRSAMLTGEARDLIRGTALGALCRRLLDGAVPGRRAA